MANYKKNIYQQKKPLKLSIDKRSLITIDKEFQIGLELYNLRKLSQAKKHFEFVLEMDRLHFNSLNLMGIISYEEKNYEIAEKYISKALLIDSKNALSHSNYGSVLIEMGKYSEAILSYDKAIKINPKFALAHSNKGNALFALKRNNEALTSYDTAIEIDPNFADAYYNRGNALYALDKIKEAISSFDYAIKLKPEYAEAYLNLGNILNNIGDTEGALLNYRKAININVKFHQAYNNLGVLLYQQQRLVEGKSIFEKALSIFPNSAEIYCNLGNILRELGHTDDALVKLNEAIRINPLLSEAYNNLGGVYKDKFHYVAALRSVALSLDLNPLSAATNQTYASMLSQLSEYENVCKYSDKAMSLVAPVQRPKVWGARLFAYIYHPDLNEIEIYNNLKEWGLEYIEKPPGEFIHHTMTKNKRLKIGYVSGDFKGHSVMFFHETLFSKHDHKNFEIFAYSNVVNPDQHTDRLKKYFDKWQNIFGISDSNAFDMIKKDQIDILVDLSGHMENNRLLLFAKKAAPIQVTWEGWSCSTGLKQIDYIILDKYMAPPGTLATEEIVRLPKTRTCYRPGENAIKESISKLPALENKFVTFGYTGRTERINHRVFKVWGEILKKLKNARLLLDFKTFADNETNNYYLKILGKYGVDTSRVEMRSSKNIFKGLADIDILLDSFPHNGGTMLFDALWMGVPVLTLASRPPLGRIGSSLMNNLGMKEWIAETEEDYVQKAINFASDIDSLALIRESLRQRMMHSPLMDEVGFASDMEEAYQKMWQRLCETNQK